MPGEQDSSDRATAPSHDALALFEIDGMPRAVVCQDAALKRAPVEILACAPVSPGKVILIFAGDVAAVEESIAAVETLVGSRRLDHLYLPGVHPAVLTALRGARVARDGAALGIFELATVAASLEAADTAVKNAAVRIGRLHAASGFGGKGYFTVTGNQSDVEAAIAAVIAVAGDRLLDRELIPAPHDELDAAVFRRPWPLDPAGS